MDSFDDDWRHALLPAESVIKEAIECLNRSLAQIVIVVTPDGGFVGTITDGDIRRGLLRGLDLTSSISEIIHRDALLAPPELSNELALQVMQANRILQLPVVDKNRHVVGLHLWDRLAKPASRENLMVIMAGGLGTRLRPQTESCPKPMLPVAGKPMLEHIIEGAKARGIRKFVLAIHYLGRTIEEYFGNGERWQVHIDYLREKSPLGTAGALGLLAPRPNLPFIVANGDLITDIRYDELLDFHNRHAATATMAVHLHEWQHPFAVVQTNGVDIIGLEEKPIVRTHVNAGVYVLSPSCLNEITGIDPCDMPTLFEKALEARRKVIAYPMHEPWLDVGTPVSLASAQLKLAGQA